MVLGGLVCGGVSRKNLAVIFISWRVGVKGQLIAGYDLTSSGRFVRPAQPWKGLSAFVKKQPR